MFRGSHDDNRLRYCQIVIHSLDNAVESAFLFTAGTLSRPSCRVPTSGCRFVDTLSPILENPSAERRAHRSVSRLLSTSRLWRSCGTVLAFSLQQKRYPNGRRVQYASHTPSNDSECWHNPAGRHPCHWSAW